MPIAPKDPEPQPRGRALITAVVLLSVVIVGGAIPLIWLVADTDSGNNHGTLAMAVFLPPVVTATASLVAVLAKAVMSACKARQVSAVYDRNTEDDGSQTDFADTVL
jgi:hypothetical protein